MEESIENIIRKFPAGKREGLIPILQEIQRETGHLSESSIKEVSRYINVPLNKIYGVASFYDQFNFARKGMHHIQVCNGTSCHLERSWSVRSEVEKILQIKTGQTTRDGKFSFEVVNCLGACNHSPVILINGKSYGSMTPEKLSRVISSIKDTKE